MCVCVWGGGSSFCCFDCNSSITEEYEEDEYLLSQESEHFHNASLEVTWFQAYFSSLHQITPLHVVAERGHTRIVEYLVDKGAQIDIQDKNGVIMHDYSKDSVVLLIV